MASKPSINNKMYCLLLCNPRQTAQNMSIRKVRLTLGQYNDRNCFQMPSFSNASKHTVQGLSRNQIKVTWVILPQIRLWVTAHNINVASKHSQTTDLGQKYQFKSGRKTFQCDHSLHSSQNGSTITHTTSPKISPAASWSTAYNFHKLLQKFIRQIFEKSHPPKTNPTQNRDHRGMGMTTGSVITSGITNMTANYRSELWCERTSCFPTATLRPPPALYADVDDCKHKRSRQFITALCITDQFFLKSENKVKTFQCDHS